MKWLVKWRTLNSTGELEVSWLEKIGTVAQLVRVANEGETALTFIICWSSVRVRAAPLQGSHCQIPNGDFDIVLPNLTDH